MLSSKHTLVNMQPKSGGNWFYSTDNQIKHEWKLLLFFCSRACSEEGEAQLRRAFFSATLATEVEEWCSLNLDNVASVTIGQRHTATDTIKQTLVYTGKALFSIKISVVVVGGFFGGGLCVEMDFTRIFQASTKCNNINSVWSYFY